MGPSLYTGLINQNTMDSLIVAIVQKYTDPDARMPYLYKRFLTPRYSASGTYSAISESITNFMLDVVATDAKLPLKNHEKFALTQGFLPKMGNEMGFNEQQLQELDTAIQLGTIPGDEVLAKLVAHADKLLFGGFNRNEYLFLQAICNGKATTTDADNVGVNFEFNFNFLPENKAYASTIWGDTGYTPLTDLRNQIDLATNRGVILTDAFMNYKTFSQIMNSDEVKNLFDTSLITRRVFEDFLLSELGLTIHIVNRVVTAQINGVDNQIPAWTDGQITLTAGDRLGDLVWTRTAEFNHRVGGVMYTDADSGTFLISRYGTNNPVTEKTSIQGRCLPVIGNVQNIYQLDTTKISA